MKMKERNEQLKSTLGAIAPKERIQAAADIPQEDTVNRQGFAAYSLADELRLVSMLNTCKIQPQFYRSENETIRELRDLIERIGMKDPYFVAQAIVYSRCLGEGMRSINHLAAALLSPFIAGKDYAKRFYSTFNKKDKKGGCIFRADDPNEIKDAFVAISPNAVLANAMKKGFKAAIENFDTYQLCKYRKQVIDVTNLVHADPNKSKAEVTIDGKKVKVLDAIMKGITISADTWEVAQSEAGQIVAKAVKEGKLTKEEANEVLAEAKADNWENLLKDGKLGMMAALRNIRNIMKNPRQEIIDMWCDLIKDGEKARAALILPIYFDLAYDIVDEEFGDYDCANQVRDALQKGYLNSIPNLARIFTGKTLVVVDRSGSMRGDVSLPGKKLGRAWYSTRPTSACCYKAGLIAASICKASNADVVKFGLSAEFFPYNKNLNVFTLARQIGTASCEATNPAAAFELIGSQHKAYDRIVFISDNEVNGKLTSTAYRNYVYDVCSPYIYGIDLAAYGTAPLKGDKVNYFFGYGPALYEAIQANEFNASDIIDEIRKIEI